MGGDKIEVAEILPPESWPHVFLPTARRPSATLAPCLSSSLAALQVEPGRDGRLAGSGPLSHLGRRGLPPPPPKTPPLRPCTAGWQTTGWRQQQGSQPDQYRCISCPFASGPFINYYCLAGASAQVAGGERREEPRVTFPAPTTTQTSPLRVGLDHLHRRGDRHNKAAWMTLPPPPNAAPFPPLRGS